MRRKRIVAVMGLASAACVAGVSAQDFSDDFESYALGGIVGQNGWTEWCNTFGVDASISDEFAHSGDQCLRGDSNDDVVQRLGATSGTWVLSVWTYVPTGMTGDAYVIVLNEYPDINCVEPPFDWSGQVHLGSDTNLVTAESEGGGGTTPLIRDQWVEVRYVVDIDNNLHDIFYGAAQITDDVAWEGDEANDGIAALDLYAAGNGTYFFDDVNFEPVEADTEVCATTATRVRGLPVGAGTVADTCTSNDVYYTSRPDVFRTVAVPPVQVQYLFTSPALNPSELRLTVEGAANVNNIFERINLRNYDTGLYESVNTRVLPTADGSVQVVITSNPGKYVHNTTGQVDALIQSNALAFSIAPVWQKRDDHVLLTIVN